MRLTYIRRMQMQESQSELHEELFMHIVVSCPPSTRYSCYVSVSTRGTRTSLSVELCACCVSRFPGEIIFKFNRFDARLLFYSEFSKRQRAPDCTGGVIRGALDPSKNCEKKNVLHERERLLKWGLPFEG